MTVFHVTPRVTLTALSHSLGCWGHRLAYQGGPEMGENGAVVRCRYLSKSFRFLGEGHSSWKLAHAHTLAWLSTRYFRWECTCRTMEEGMHYQGTS